MYNVKLVWRRPASWRMTGPRSYLLCDLLETSSSKKNLLCTTKIFDGQITLQNNMASLRGCQIEL